MTGIKGQRGFATLETLVASGFVFAFVTGGFATTYFAFARTWLDRNAYEGSVCLATDSPRTACERKLRESLSRALPVGSLARLSMTRTSSSVDVQGAWSIDSFLTLSFQDHRALPLRGSP